jgi:hypothetical protein
MTRSSTYWLNALLWCAGMFFATVRGWTVTTAYLARHPSEWQHVALMWGGLAALILWALYNQKRTRARQLDQLNAMRPDQMTLTNDGVKCDGPNGATALVPWRNFKSWREGRRIMLVERSEGKRFVMLPVSQLSEIERMPIRQFLQGHISVPGR